MSLVNRVAGFFLVALASALLIYSVVFYCVVRYHLQQQFDQQLHGALNLLVAAVEVEPDDVKFELADHTVSLGTEDGLEDIRWVVCDEQGLIVDRSANLETSAHDNQALLAAARATDANDTSSQTVGSWRVLQQRLAAAHPKPVSERDPLERAVIVVTVARSTLDLQGNLQLVAMLVTLLPLTTGLIAAGIVRWYCAKAIQPVRDMASQTRAMAGRGFEERLSQPNSKDELADLSHAFNALLDQLAMMFDRQRHFTGAAAHQLRTPLTALLGQIDVALRRPRSPAEYSQTLTVLRGQTLELQRIVESLLFLARAEQDESPPDTCGLPLADWLDRYLQHWRDDPRYGDLVVQVEPAIELTTSPTLLGQLLDNLVSNALKYSPADTTVIISATQLSQALQLTVADHGPGIPANEREMVFQPFFRSVQARQTGVSGHGLGLAIAARIATSLGATLHCEDNPGGGSRLVVTFSCV